MVFCLWSLVYLVKNSQVGRLWIALEEKYQDENIDLMNLWNRLAKKVQEISYLIKW